MRLWEAMLRMGEGLVTELVSESPAVAAIAWLESANASLDTSRSRLMLAGRACLRLDMLDWSIGVACEGCLILGCLLSAVASRCKLTVRR